MRRYEPGNDQRIGALQKQNQRLRKIIADQRIDMEILKEAIEYDSKNLQAQPA